jgi:hypothetical protein
MERRRVGDTFDRVIASLEELFDVAWCDPIALTVRGVNGRAYLETIDGEGSCGGTIFVREVFYHCVEYRLAICGGEESRTME